MNRYYYLLRPPAPFCQPGGFHARHAFPDGRRWVESIQRHAWGWVEYVEPLTDEQVYDFDLMPESE